MPSRKMILSIIFITFVLIVMGVLAWYFSPILFGPPAESDQESGGGGVNLFPFGDNGAQTPDSDEEEGGGGDADADSDEEEEVSRMPRLRMVSEGPVIASVMAQSAEHSGLQGEATASTTDTSIANIIRYVQLGTGHVYEARTDDPEIIRLSNTTIPRINEAHFVGSDRILMRYTDDVGNFKLFSAQLADNASQSAATPKRLQGVFLSDGVRYLDVNPAGDVVWLQYTADGGARVISTDALGDSQTQIYESPLSEWRVDWFGSEDEVLLRSTPSYESFGMAFTLDVSTGALRPYGTARKALEVYPSTDRSRAIISLKADKETRSYLYKRDANEYIEIVPEAFAQKCVYAENREIFYCAAPVGEISFGEPDLWYQGVTSYQDDIWQIDANTGEAQIVVSPSGMSDDPIDVIDLSLSPDEQFLYFRDKDTRSLWTFQLDYLRGSYEPVNATLNGSGSEPAPAFGTTTDGEVFFE